MTTGATPALQAVVAALRPGLAPHVAAPSGAWAPLIAAAAQADDPAPLLVVTPTSRLADEIREQLGAWTDLAVAAYPAWETLPHEQLQPSPDVVGVRTQTLARLCHPDASIPDLAPVNIVVAPAQALLQPINPDHVTAPNLVVRVGAELELADFSRQLVRSGFDRVDMVERRGQFAVRGGLVDVFPAHLEHPVRIELFGDEIDEVRSFSVTDQRTLTKLTDPVICFPVAEGTPTTGLSFAQAVRQAATILLEPIRIADRADEVVRTSAEFAEAAWQTAATSDQAPVPDQYSLSLFDWADVLTELTEVGAVTRVSTLPTEGPPQVLPVGPFAGPNQVLDVLRSAVQAKWRVILTVPAAGTAKRLADVLREAEISFQTDPPELLPGTVALTVGHVPAGFRIPSQELAVVASEDFGRRQKRGNKTALPSRRRRQVDPLSLQPGDLVVHDKHGIGRFVELTERESRGAVREFLVVEYAPNKRGLPPDTLFVPSDQLNSITRYVGSDAPGLSKLGGSDWAKTKGRARKAVRQIADELIRLYAKRQSSRGFQFPPDTVWQRELETTFAHVETADQLQGIEDIKADMERPIPMDRLICGDVGYGKTELAIRAAFKAIQAGKQVAVLVPTTLLVQQHLTTFSERMDAFGVKIAGLSRFATGKEVAAATKGIAEGSIDLVIGTHRLLTPDIKFKDLGLVIVDEEQRFGVEQKEHLKALRANVDMLTMSATPIPRTLEMAVTGIREMTTIATPPEERLPVLTFVGPYEQQRVRAAIHRELLREGQVFFVHNRVQSIDKVAADLSALVPEATIAVAHGQMSEAALERVVVDFWDGEIDVLVCTTIVESGIDIANANTLIVDRADTMGLSQLHQLRGRVGRSRSRAYAYFMYPADRSLSETAQDRLATIAANSELGGGMQIALKDLEIRGSGNLLGAEQSGHIADVGFDLYVRMVGEAMAEAKGDTDQQVPDVRVDLPIDAHLPPDYIREESLRLEGYQNLARAKSNTDIDEVVAELKDRFGPLPPAAAALVKVARLRIAIPPGITEVIMVGDRLKISPVELKDSRRIRLARLYPGAIYKAATRQLWVPLSKKDQKSMSGDDVLDWAGGIVSAVLVDQ